MSHPFGDLISHHLHRKHGLSQSKLAAAILQAPSVITDMCQGKRLQGRQARERVIAIIDWLQQQGVLATQNEANALLTAAGMAALYEDNGDEAQLMAQLDHTASQRLHPTISSAPTHVRPLHSDARTSALHNLPIPLTAFIGRSDQIDQLAQHLQRTRLLTLTGVGGVGKTRLAIALATLTRERFSDGVWFIDLAPLTQPDLLAQTILSVLKLPDQPDQTALGTLTTYLAAKHALLILDNCEHLIDACARWAEAVLARCPQIHLLTTSREALRIGGEIPWRVPSLTRPEWLSSGQRQALLASKQEDRLSDLAQFEAVQLLLNRVQNLQPDFVLTSENAYAVARICQRLDGIPLALEMAAAQVTALTVAEIATQLEGALDARFQLLTSGARTAPQRQQTLRATLEWSYSLLTPPEQHLLACLAVFVGGWTAAAAEAICGEQVTSPLRADQANVEHLALTSAGILPLLTALVRKSLVIADQRMGQTRYRLLETVRQFAAEHLPDMTHRQHGQYYLRLLATQGERLAGPDQRSGLDILRTDLANIGVAWHWAVDQHAFDLLGPAVHALFLFCDASGAYRTGTALFAQAAAELQASLAGSAGNQPTLEPLWGQVLTRLGACEVMLSNLAEAQHHLQNGLRTVLVDQDRALALAYLGVAADERGEMTLSDTLYQESLAISQRCNDLAGMADALRHLSSANSNLSEARRLATESLLLWRQVGRPDRIANLTNFLAWHVCCLGDFQTANRYWSEGLTLCEQLDLPNEKAWVLLCQAMVAWCQGKLTVAEQTIEEALIIYSELGRHSMIGLCQAVQSLVLISTGRVEQAIIVAQQAVAITRAANSQLMLGQALSYLGAAKLAAGDPAAARHLLIESIQRAWAYQYLFNLMTALYFFAELLVVEAHATDLSYVLERRALAVTVLTCVQVQAATWQIYKDKAAQLQAEVERELPAELRTTAIARGQSYTLEGLVSTLLEELPEALLANPKQVP